MRRPAWAAALTLCASCAALAAPAPPARVAAAEAVVKPPRGDPKGLAAKLASAPFLGAVARSKGAASLGCLSGEKDPAAWLAARLKLATDESRGTVTLRLVNCPARDAVALLNAVVEAYKADSLRQPQVTVVADGGVVLFQAVQQANGAAAPVNRMVKLGGVQAKILALPVIDTSKSMAQDTGLSKAEVDKSVLQAPKVLRPGLPGPAEAGR
jgi:hypothetical protein